MTPLRPMQMLLLEPRARHRRSVTETWNRALSLAHERTPPELVTDGSATLRSLRDHLENHTFEACIFPLFDRQHSPQRYWQILEAAGYDIGYLFHADVSRGAGKIAPVPYLCKTRFGSHQRVLTLLGLMDMTVLEVRPPDDTPHERYRKILNRITEGFWDVGPDLVISYANTAFKQMVDDDRPVGRNLSEYFEAEDSARLESILSEQQKGIIIPFCLQLKNRGGRGGPSPLDQARTVVQIDPSPRFGWGGKYLGSSALVRDVTDLEIASQASLKKERHLYALYQVASTLTSSFGLADLVAAATAKVRELLAVDATCAFVRAEDGSLQPVAAGAKRSGVTDALLDIARRWSRESPEGKPAHIVRDTGKARDPIAREAASHGIRSMAAIPLRSGETDIGWLWLASRDSAVMTRDWVSLIISVGHQLAVAMANALHVEARLEEEARRKLFYREAVFAITNGKLSLVERADLPEVSEGRALGERDIAGPQDVQACRKLAEELLAAEGVPSERCFDVAMCVSEAATNALIHGKGGRMRILAVPEDRFRIVVEDNGSGINFSLLPNAVLKRGYSTAVSMGLGFTMILEMMDAVYLSTDAQGTVVVMEIHKNPQNAELEAWLAKVSD